MIEALVPAASWRWLANAALAIIVAAAVTGASLAWLVVGGACVALCSLRIWASLVVVAVVALPSLILPTPLLAEGPVEAYVELATDPRPGQFGPWALGSIDGAGVFLDLGESQGAAGETRAIVGEVTGASSSIGGRDRQVVRVESLGPAIGQLGPYASAGHWVRNQVVGRLSGGSEARSLLAGFLVGDTSGLGEVTIEAMRLAGLSHFVAVSGSNVALFLGLIALVSIPVGVGSRRRAVIGLIALPVFVVATGFEPSVLRASAMAAVVLLGKLFGIALEAWQVVAVATIVVLGYDPWLVESVGFQLSLAATCGVIAGARWPGGRSLVTRALLVTLGAQLAVAPLLLWHFGSIPLLSPIANVFAAPLVTGATVLAMGGIAWDALLGPAEVLAGLVIYVARLASSWPHVGWTGFAVAVGVLPVALRVRKRSPAIAALGGALALAILLLPHQTRLEPGQVAVLDVGQGDAILLAGGEGRYALVDGGADPSLLLKRLGEYGVRSLELVIMTHGDADHAGGLTGLIGTVTIGQVWERTEPHAQPASDRFLAMVPHSVLTVNPEVGTSYHLGGLSVEVLSPSRRFASPNDQSLVLLVWGESNSMLLTGDIEEVAQSELHGLDVDVLKVPHHGAGTSDEGWLGSTGAWLAVISVGPNDFGHPVPWVIEVLEESGAIVRRTDRDGTVVVDLSQ